MPAIKPKPCSLPVYCEIKIIFSNRCFRPGSGRCYSLLYKIYGVLVSTRKQRRPNLDQRIILHDDECVLKVRLQCHIIREMNPASKVILGLATNCILGGYIREACYEITCTSMFIVIGVKLLI